MHLEKKQILDKLKEVSVFAELEEKDLLRVAEIATITKTQRGKNIIKEGDSGDSMFVLFYGVVKIKKRVINEEEEYTVINLSHEDHAYFGELALLDGGSRSATVTATENSILIEISRDSFNDLCNELPGIGYKVYHKISSKLSKSLRKANQDIVTLFEALVMEIRKTN